MKALLCSLALAGVAMMNPPLSAAEIRVQKDREYATVDGQVLKLDLHLPISTDEPAARKPTLLVWIHGGAWRAGSKTEMPLGELVKSGEFAVASIDYRLSPVARFPAQIHDIKGAIRFLRAHQQELGFDAVKTGIVGSSAGGHLAVLVGVTNGVPALEGTVGTDLKESSSVQAIVDLYGPTNFLTILKQSTPHGLSVRVPALELLLGGQPDGVPELAKLASPVFHVDRTDPPLLLIHGDQDPQVPINQSHELHAAYKQAGLPVTFEVVHGGAHGGKEFTDTARMTLIRQFLKTHLRTP